MWPVQRRHALVRRNVTGLPHYELVEVQESDTQHRAVRKHAKALFEFSDTAVKVLCPAAIFEHVGGKYGDKENQPNRSTYERNAPGTMGRLLFPEGVDDQHNQQREDDGAEHRHQRHANRRNQPDGVKHPAASAQLGPQGCTKEEEEEKGDSTDHCEVVIVLKRPVRSRDTSRKRHCRTFGREQILSCDDFGGRYRCAND